MLANLHIDIETAFDFLRLHEQFKTRQERELVMKASTQESVYESADWDNPVVKSFDALVLNAGDKLKLEATYTNPTSEAVRFSTGSDDDFTGVFGYYYKD